MCKKLIIQSLVILIILFSFTQAEKLICKGPAPGEIYFVGPDVSPDSLTGSFLYHSIDYGSTLVKKYEDPGMWAFCYITADATPGVLYRVSPVY